ncbi:poly(3-hydroxyalkanoate) depolymerase [Geodermatophilus sp. DF01-2]|uniref:poly(3-hydroxyalkanoate) depolymerase n=1 Tax=Geodermatophilus sp. DF01-2 TaxID=2559610 RepID=UPI001072FF2F|nr:poly(3-hydroxyalkanoate) depolymerase [Geodermatophilus sp. DF01_2]TFV60460.1 poly(3-hydroxyalkanoate) depolymerase [Geodermatophilus sp. DF01_2]
MSSTSRAGAGEPDGGEIVRSLAVGGRTLRVAVRSGDGSVPPLLLMNGIGASLEVLQPFVDALDHRRTVIRFDVPGVGGSPRPVVPYVLGTFSPVVAGLLGRLGHDGQVDVLGLSWGGGLAQHFAVQHRRRVRRLVLVGTGTGSLMVPAHPRVLSKMLTPRRHRDPAYAREIAGLIYGGTIRTDPARAARVLHAATRVGPRRGYYYQLAASAGWSSLPFLRLIRQPTLVVAGDDDPIIPVANAHIMARLIPDSTLHLYHGGHLALVTEAHELAPVVERFLDRAP